MELHQLGLPKEHSNAICKVYSKDQNRLQLQLKEHHLMAVDSPTLHFGCSADFKKDLILCHVKRYSAPKNKQSLSNTKLFGYSTVSNRHACTAINLQVKLHPTFAYFILHFY